MLERSNYQLEVVASRSSEICVKCLVKVNKVLVLID